MFTATLLAHAGTPEQLPPLGGVEVGLGVVEVGLGVVDVGEGGTEEAGGEDPPEMAFLIAASNLLLP